MSLRGLWWFVPEEALPLILSGGAILVILGVIRPGRLLLIVFGLALLPLLGPIVEAVFEILPWWLTIAILLMIAISFIRSVSALFLGDRASDHMVGTLAADAVRGVLRLLFGLPFILFRALARFVR